MDKLKYVKIENEDGSLSDNIPLGVDAENVDTNDGSTVEIELNNLKNKDSSQDNSINNLNNKINIQDNSINNLKNQINSLASSSPLVASSVSEMTDTSKVYVNTTDGNWYYYNGSSWEIGGVYQATQIADNSIFPSMYSDILKNSQNLQIPSFEKNNGFYNIYGVLTQNDNFRYSSPIKLLKNQTIFARVRAYDTISVISSCDKNGNNVKSLVTGQGNFFADYQYKANEDTYIIISGANDTFLCFIKDYLNIFNLNQFSLNILSLNNPDFNKNSGYIDNLGQIQDNSLYNYTSPILLLQDDEIFIDCEVEENISVISSSLLNNTNELTPIILSNPSNSYYHYKATNSCYVVLSYKNTTLPSILIKNVNKIPYVDYSTNSGYINIYGILTENSTFKHTSPIKILKNQTIKCTLRGYNTVSVISKCDDEGNNITPLVIGIDNKLRDYEYTSDEDSYIIISGVNQYPFLIYIEENTSQGIINLNEQINEINQNLNEQINEINQNLNEQINEINQNLNTIKKVPLLSIFETIGIIGDSHTAGAIEGTGSKDCKNLSTMAQVCKQCGNTPKFYARSGESCKSWLDYNYNVEECKAYIIALGSNDRGSQYPPGTSLDINTDNETFYGYYSKIISKIKTIAPNAKIFLFSLYGNDTDPASIPYNDAIKYFADNTENCFFVDMRNSYTIYQDYKIGGHMSAIGYTFIADYVINQTNDLIISNYDKFNNVGIY